MSSGCLLVVLAEPQWEEAWNSSTIPLLTADDYPQYLLQKKKKKTNTPTKYNYALEKHQITYITLQYTYKNTILHYTTFIDKYIQYCAINLHYFIM